MRILVVDDEEILRDFLNDLLVCQGHEVECAANGREALQILGRSPKQLVITDIRMPHMDGVTLLAEIQRLPTKPYVIMLTGHADIQSAVRAIRLGAYDYMLKPIEADILANRVQRLARQIELEAERVEEHRKAVYAARMSAVGQLAAGAAHEINNPTTYIRGNAQIMKKLVVRLQAAVQAEDWKEVLRLVELLDENDGELIRGIEDGTERIRRITGGLTAFASIQAYERPLPLQLDECAREALLLLGSRRESLVLETAWSDNLPPVSGRRQALVHAVVAILVNAFQAVAGQETGRIQIGTRCVSGRVELWIEDSGPGVPLDLREKIFEPFFTTREVNQGAGLGLSTAYGIIFDHGGTIQVGGSELGGARFTIALPIN